MDSNFCNAPCPLPAMGSCGCCGFFYLPAIPAAIYCLPNRYGFRLHEHGLRTHCLHAFTPLLCIPTAVTGCLCGIGLLRATAFVITLCQPGPYVYVYVFGFYAWFIGCPIFITYRWTGLTLLPFPLPCLPPCALHPPPTFLLGIWTGKMEVDGGQDGTCHWPGLYLACLPCACLPCQPPSPCITCLPRWVPALAVVSCLPCALHACCDLVPCLPMPLPCLAACTLPPHRRTCLLPPCLALLPITQYTYLTYQHFSPCHTHITRLRDYPFTPPSPTTGPLVPL